MILRITGHDFHYECENICRVFFPDEKITVVTGDEGEDSREVTAVYAPPNACVTAVIDGETRRLETVTSPEKAELDIAKLIFRALSEITGYTPPWGVLTGVRPAKLMLSLIEESGEEEAVRYFTGDLLVKPAKASLALSVAGTEKRIVDSARPESFSLYIGIPFCPSRCSYCSFVSHSIENPNAKKLLPGYVEKLALEIAETGRIARETGLKLESIYFGGGTPGVLEPSQLDELMCAIERNYDSGSLREYTVEIGRPDTVTPAKLAMMKLHGVDRISINPQTFSEKTLELIGRRHSPGKTLEAYRLASAYGFSVINMDLIAGLPGETAETFAESLDTAISLSPGNITVHTLALKRSSTLGTQGYTVQSGEEAEKMLAYAGTALPAAGYYPYYMYRQSKCVGNLENVGWCKEGKEGFYNVIMMEEAHTVLACGAGAVTKLCEPQGKYVERIFNYKYPYEYLSGFDELIARKSRIPEFYRERMRTDGAE